VTTENQNEEQEHVEGAGGEPKVEPKVEDKPLIAPDPEERKYVDPNSPEYLAQLEQEGAERAELAAQIAPYELVPEQFKDEAAAYHEDISAIARDAGIPAAEAEVLLHLAMGDTLDAVSKDMSAVLSPGQLPGPNLANPQECRAILRNRFGDAAAIIEKAAIEEFRSLPKSVQAYLDKDHGDGRLLTNSPSVLLMLAVKRLGWTRLSQESAQKELEKLNDKGRSLDPREQKRMLDLTHKQSKLQELDSELSSAEASELSSLKRRGKLDAFDMVKRQVLGHITSRGKSSDHKGLTDALSKRNAPKVTPSKREALEKEARTLRLDPGYYRKDAPNHKALLSRMAVIMAELNPEGGSH